MQICIKKLAAYVICDAMLVTGSMTNVVTYAQENETIEIATELDAETDNSSDYDLEEDEEISELVCNQSEKKNSNPIVSEFPGLSNDYFKCKFKKRVTGLGYTSSSGTYGHYNYEYNTKGEYIKTTKVMQGNIYSDLLYEYYDNGDLKKVQYEHYNNIIEKVEEYEYEYDNNGKCVKKYYYRTDYSNDFQNIKGNRKLLSVSNYEYDGQGFINKINVYNYSNDSNEEICYEYDINGNCNKITTSRNNSYNITEYEYSDNGVRKIRTSYDSEGNVSIYEIRDYTYIFDQDGDVYEIKMTGQDSYFFGSIKYEDSAFTENYWVYYDHIISTSGIYCSKNYPNIQAGINIQKSNPNDDVEYRWVGCNNNDPEHWFEVSPWTKNNNWMNWTPEKSGGYVFVCYARIVGQPETEIQYAFGTEYHKQIKGICQMPYTGEGGGYLIGI